MSILIHKKGTEIGHQYDMIEDYNVRKAKGKRKYVTHSFIRLTKIQKRRMGLVQGCLDIAGQTVQNGDLSWE